MPLALIEKSKLPPGEVEICRRLRQVREKCAVNQPAFARMIGTTRTVISNLEYALAPLRYDLAQRICSSQDINQRWLATGDGPIHPFIEIKSLSAQIPRNVLFSEAYSRFIRTPVEIWWREVAARFPDSPTLGIRRQIWPERDFPALMRLIMARLLSAQTFVRKAELAESAAKKQALLDEAGLNLAAAHETAAAIERSLRPEVKSFFEDRTLSTAKAILGNTDKLDTENRIVSVATVSSKDVPTWNQLKKTISKLTAGHGQKAALADELGVSRQVLGNWLADSEQGAPNAELTLRLLKWSLDPKRKVIMT